MTYDLADQGGWEAAQTGFLLIRLQPELVQAAAARTPEGRRAKLQVLLRFVLPDDWNRADEYIDWHVRHLARALMFEMVGGEPEARIRDQYS